MISSHALLELLKTCPLIEVVDLDSGYKLANDVIKIVSERKNISKISLCNCKTVDNDGFRSLSQLNSLRSLDLSRCPKFSHSENLQSVVCKTLFLLII
jgi:hypothetical protein